MPNKELKQQIKNYYLTKFCESSRLHKDDYCHKSINTYVNHDDYDQPRYISPEYNRTNNTPYRFHISIKYNWMRRRIYVSTDEHTENISIYDKWFGIGKDSKIEKAINSITNHVDERMLLRNVDNVFIRGLKILRILNRE